MESEDLIPRMSDLNDALNADVLDERYLRTLPSIRRYFYRFLPTIIAQIIEAFLVHKKYDVVFSWYEQVGLPFAILQRFARSKVPHVLQSSWMTKGRKRWIMKHAHKALNHIVFSSSVQSDIAVKELGIPSSRVTTVKYPVDVRFWQPMNGPSDLICAVGMESRDYPTLIEALRGLDIPCHIATGLSRGQLFETVKSLYRIDDLPRNIIVGKKNYVDLRKLYSRSRFVVIPLLPTDTDNGVTTILEAMSMGKVVICSRVRGQVDVIENRKTGIYVPQGDPDALRQAILELWYNPA
ncbi:MAG TPA: glycosyltransferase family 4 protein, partial [bacterium]|nr:glycosyltransferase family 4 protein [bacterium]